MDLVYCWEIEGRGCGQACGSHKLIWNAWPWLLKYGGTYVYTL